MKNELLILLIAVLLLILGINLLKSSGSPEVQDKTKGEDKILTTTITVTTSKVWDRSKPLKEIDLSLMQHLRQGEISVYFEPEQRRLAHDVLQALQQGWQLVAERLGIVLGAFDVVLVPLSEAERAEIGGLYLKQRVQVKQPLHKALQRPSESPQPPFPSVVSPGLNALKHADLMTRASIYSTMPHEALHQAVSTALDKGWRSDLRTRGLEDGLAEYVGYIVTKKFDPEVHKWSLEGRQKNVQDALQGREHATYDLTREFLGHLEIYVDQKSEDQKSEGISAAELAGYGVSLAFWLQIVEKHGEGVIRAFWQRLSQRGFPNAQEAAHILSELTGEDIWTKLQNMDLQEVLRTLE